MKSLNKVQLIGNVGADPEVRTVGSSTVASFNLATSRNWKDAQGQPQERTEWHRVQVWGKLADVVGSYVRKGGRVYVEGQIEYRSYDKDGSTRYVTEINARDLILLDGKPADAAPARAAAAAASYDDPNPKSVWGEQVDDLPF